MKSLVEQKLNEHEDRLNEHDDKIDKNAAEI